MVANQHPDGQQLTPVQSSINTCTVIDRHSYGHLTTSGRPPDVMKFTMGSTVHVATTVNLYYHLNCGEKCWPILKYRELEIGSEFQ